MVITMMVIKIMIVIIAIYFMIILKNTNSIILTDFVRNNLRILGNALGEKCLNPVFLFSLDFLIDDFFSIVLAGMIKLFAYTNFSN